MAVERRAARGVANAMSDEIEGRPEDNTSKATGKPAARRKTGPRGIDWAPILADHESGRFRTQKELAGHYGVSTKALSNRITASRVEPVSDRADIIDRLVRLVDLQVADFQREMHAMRTENRRSGEKEVVLLGKIAANLEKLMAMEAGSIRPRNGKQRTKDIVDLRSKLIERIEHLKRQ